MLQALLKAGVVYALSELVFREKRLRFAARRLLLGGLLLAGAFLIGYVGIALLFISLFLYLAEIEALLRPALITGVAASLLAGLVGWEGWRRFRLR